MIGARFRCCYAMQSNGILTDNQKLPWFLSRQNFADVSKRSLENLINSNTFRVHHKPVQGPLPQAKVDKAIQVQRAVENIWYLKCRLKL